MPGQPTEIDRLRNRLDKVREDLKTRVVTFPDHEDPCAIEAEFIERANRIVEDLGWIDDRITEKIIYRG